MSDRCEMCGAKLRPEDSACRECGAALSIDGDSSSVLDIPTAGTADAWTSPEVFPDALPDEQPPRRVSPLLGVIVVAVLGLGSAAYMLSSSESGATASKTAPDRAATTVASVHEAVPESSAECPELEALAGTWSFITEVTGSRVVQSLGLNGFYELDVELDGCSATAQLTKIGYTARKFTNNRIQRASAPLVPGTGFAAGFHSAQFALKSDVGPHGLIEMSFTVHDGRLSGIYRQRGARWKDTGLSGFVEGTRDGEYSRDPVLDHQPCITRCGIACDTAQRDDVASEAVQTCVETCKADDTAAAHCGDARELPESFALALEGPAPRSTLCKAIGGCAKRLSKSRTKSPSLGSDRLPDPWQEATMVRSKREGGPRLAIHGEAGWYLSAPLLELPTSAKLGLLRLYARQLGEGRERKYLLAVVRSNSSNSSKTADESFVACRLEAAGPRCTRVPKSRNDYVTALPEHNLSVGALEASNTAAAVYRW